MRQNAYAVFERQHAVASRHQLLRAGMTSSEIDHDIASGVLVVVHRGVYRLAGAALTERGALIAATLSRPAAIVSHESAGRLWGLLADPPPVPTLTVPRRRRGPASGALVVHRSGDLEPTAVTVHQGIRCTRPLRTLVDLAGVLPAPVLDDAVDRALERGQAKPSALAFELAMLRRHGRPGVQALERSLTERGLVGAPEPSVLESRFVRLLGRHGIVPLAAEVRPAGFGVPWRIDFLLAPGVHAEVDGYAHHGNTRDFRRDLHRMNRFQAAGLVVLRFSWFDVCNDGARVIADITDALARAAARSA